MRTQTFGLIFFLALALAGCGSAFDPGGIGVTPATPREITYDGAITFTVKNGMTVPGTNIAYQGKAPDGRAILSIGGLQALKSNADSLSWSGPLGAGAQADLNLRVLSYDETSLILAGTIHLVIPDPNPQPGASSPNLAVGYTIPVTYTVARGAMIPGSLVQYVGVKPQGAEFTNLDQFPYRQRFDSVVWQGRLRDKIAVRLELRLLNYSEDAALLGGAALVMFEQ